MANIILDDASHKNNLDNEKVTGKKGGLESESVVISSSSELDLISFTNKPGSNRVFPQLNKPTTNTTTTTIRTYNNNNNNNNDNNNSTITFDSSVSSPNLSRYSSDDSTVGDTCTNDSPQPKISIVPPSSSSSSSSLNHQSSISLLLSSSSIHSRFTDSRRPRSITCGELGPRKLIPKSPKFRPSDSLIRPADLRLPPAHSVSRPASSGLVTSFSSSSLPINNNIIENNKSDNNVLAGKEGTTLAMKQCATVAEGEMLLCTSKDKEITEKGRLDLRLTSSINTKKDEKCVLNDECGNLNEAEKEGICYDLYESTSELSYLSSTDASSAKNEFRKPSQSLLAPAQTNKLTGHFKVSPLLTATLDTLQRSLSLELPCTSSLPLCPLHSQLSDLEPTQSN